MNEHWLLSLVKRLLGRTKPPADEPTRPSLFDTPKEVASSMPSSPSTVPPFLVPRSERPRTASPASHVPKKTMYVNSHIGLRVRSEPHIGNNILEILHYGDTVDIDGQDDSWAHIEHADGHTGWVSAYYLSEDLPPDALVTPTPGKVPHFVIAQPNRADDPNTIEVRRVIKDTLGGGKSGLDLQAAEYVQYRLAQQGVFVAWPSEPISESIKWVEFFERHGYHASGEPSVGAAIFFTSGLVSKEANEIGHVAFVEGVFADGSIKISEANWPPPGKYNERIITKRELHERYNARFVKFS